MLFFFWRQSSFFFSNRCGFMVGLFFSLSISMESCIYTAKTIFIPNIDSISFSVEQKQKSNNFSFMVWWRALSFTKKTFEAKKSRASWSEKDKKNRNTCSIVVLRSHSNSSYMTKNRHGHTLIYDRSPTATMFILVNARWRNQKYKNETHREQIAIRTWICICNMGIMDRSIHNFFAAAAWWRPL